MPSGKKARGRKNRAKKEATRTADLRSLWEPTILASDTRLDVLRPCEHNHELFDLQIPRQSTVVLFMNHIAGKGFFDRATRFPNEPVMKTCYSLTLNFPRVQEEDNERALAIALLLRFLCNVFVSDAAIEGELWFHQQRDNEAAICCMIYLLELLGRYSDVSVVARRAVKMSNNFADGNRRDLVKFVAKRLPCACLKELHRAARKKLAKVSHCHGCEKRFPRTASQTPDRSKAPYDTRVIDLAQDRYLTKRVGLLVFVGDVDHLILTVTKFSSCSPSLAHSGCSDLDEPVRLVPVLGVFFEGAGRATPAAAVPSRLGEPDRPKGSLVEEA
ncbi:hypothetical protein THAOC_26733 [Thalassiosira oceanica]|uniref:Uncharacterized protein n=1 Tax=Thalassiosira oceanica TaxID=159749 RepID=K0S4F0_THAOC|nr:hypothetical protein THAOC_26733 [Thalassiosira oceanica]|eukprot:EJK53757.1 hypothetical protein THAOC_26733 [Thalassiosira oceanica]